MTKNARRMMGQKSSGEYITSIHGGAIFWARLKPVVVVIVRSICKSGSSPRKACASFNAIATSPTLTA